MPIADLPAVLRPGHVGISGVMPLDETGYPCLLRTDVRWNGWAIPYFDKAAVDHIVSDTARLLTEHGPDTVENVEWSGDDIRVISMQGTDEEYVEILESVEVEGTQYWCIGAWAWTWETWDD